ncbi:MAG TPA: response regulator [Chloroflexia bacterium]|nr:response regulator [Chloroflexia bacterium]
MTLVLVVDDEPSVRRLVCTTLEMRSYGVRAAEAGNEALAIVASEQPDLIVLDWMLPDMTGLDVCRGVRANPTTAHVPIIFLTAIDSVDNKVAGFDAGADDYLTKPFEPQELLARVTVQLRKAAERGQINPLTHLPGNAAIEKAIHARLEAPHEEFALFYFDLNDFKSYNDYFGFSWGDQLLKALAGIITQAMRTQGDAGVFVGHIGGDDFVGIALPAAITQICEQAIAEFDTAALRLCAAAGAPDGFVGQDRAGYTRRFGPPSLSIGVVTNEHRTFHSPLEVGQVAAHIKKVAKQRPGSAYLVATARMDEDPAVPAGP